MIRAETMSEFDPKMDTAFQEYARHLLVRHRLLCAGKGDSEEIADAEDAMEAIWPTFDEVQRRSLNGMASDLIWIRTNGAPPPKGRKTAADVPEVDQKQLEAAMKAKQWHSILHYLRLCAPVFQAASLARERSVAYSAIGLDEYASEFNNGFVNLSRSRGGHVALAGYTWQATAMVAALMEWSKQHAVMVWETNGVKAVETHSDDLAARKNIEYKACA